MFSQFCYFCLKMICELIGSTPLYNFSLNPSRARWSCGLIHHVLDQKDGGSNLTAVNQFFFLSYRPGQIRVCSCNVCLVMDPLWLCWWRHDGESELSVYTTEESIQTSLLSIQKDKYENKHKRGLWQTQIKKYLNPGQRVDNLCLIYCFTQSKIKTNIHKRNPRLHSFLSKSNSICILSFTHFI